jgi:hypothetical protein
VSLSLRRIRELSWRQFFSSGAMSRGIEYAQQGAVLSRRFSPQQDSMIIHGEVLGSGSEPYALEITCNEENAKLVLSSTCTCSVGNYCKHAAAVLHSLEDITESETEVTRAQLEQWDRWFERVALLGSGRAPATTENKLLGFVFSSAQDGSPIAILRVRPAWFRQRSNGQYVEVQALTGGELATRHWVNHVDDAQYIFLARLMSASVVHSQGVYGYSLEGRRGEALLQELLSSQLCIWKRLTQPLVLGKSRAMEWQWQMQEDGTQRLAVQSLNGLKIARSDNLWYVDEEISQIGLIMGDSASAIAAYDMPSLDSELVEHVAKRWPDLKQVATLPPPPKAPIAENWIAVPKAEVTLKCMTLKKTSEATNAATSHVLFASLCFDYAGIAVPAEPMSRRAYRDYQGRSVVIERNLEMEQQHIEILRNTGFIEIGKSPLARIAQSKLKFGDWTLKDARPDDTETFLQRVPTLRESGLLVRFAADFPTQLLELQKPISITWSATDNPNLITLNVTADIEGESISLLPLLQRTLESKSLAEIAATGGHDSPYWCISLDEKRQLILRREHVRNLVSPLIEWLDGAKLEQNQLVLPHLAIAALAHLEEGNGFVQKVEQQQLRQQLVAIQNQNKTKPTHAPEKLQATLRAYQLEGLHWLESLRTMGVGGLLADDMGLGKTVQVLAHLLLTQEQKDQAMPSLVICPTSVLLNWAEQAARFAPSLNILTLRGADREEHFHKIPDYDLVLTTYPLLGRDSAVLAQYKFDIAIFDEAQALKNAHSKTAKAARDIRATRKLMVTGTPLENHLGELWTQMDLALPGLFGTQRTFRRYYRLPIEKFADQDRQAQLRQRLAPYMLRRTKVEVAPELPPKTEVIHHIELHDAQRDLYESIRIAMHERVHNAITTRGVKKSSVVVLDALLKLRQVCCDSRLLKNTEASWITESAKLDALMLMLDSLIAEGRRILLFSQFTQMLDLIEIEVDKKNWDFVRLDGDTIDREQPVKRFMKGKTPLFLLSLKAGGTGLNLTVADTVVHYDPWWNPAVETQATDRAHRIGQDKPVFVYKLICVGTIEDKIQVLQQRKSDLARAVLENTVTNTTELTLEEINQLFAPLA